MLVGLHIVTVTVFLVGSAIAIASLGLIARGAFRRLVPLAEAHERAGLIIQQTPLEMLRSQ